MIYMNKKIYMIIACIIIVLAIVIGVMYLVDLNRMKKEEPVVFSTWGSKYAPVLKQNVSNDNVQLNSNGSEKYQKFSKTVEGTKIELNIPNGWNYEEVRQG